MKEEKIVENAKQIGEEVIKPGLENLKDKHPSIGEVRGLGVFWAIELVKNRKTKEPLVPYNAAGEAAAPMGKFTAECKNLGLMPFVNMNRTHVVPPCNVSKDEVLEGLEILDKALRVADEFVTN
jgi:taurine---2-oxoglutarate transaminase